MANRVLPEGYVRAAAEGFYGSSTWANVFYFDMFAHLADPPLDVIAWVKQAVHNFYHDGITLGNFVAAFSTQVIKITYRYSSTEQLTIRVADVQLGTHSGDGEPVQVCVLINWLVGDPRRGGKPRTYLTGVPEGVLSDDAHIDPGYIAGVNGLLATWLGSLATLSAGGITGGALVDMSFVDNKLPRAVGHPIPILGVGINPVAATQRRRIDRLRPS